MMAWKSGLIAQYAGAGSSGSQDSAELLEADVAAMPFEVAVAGGDRLVRKKRMIRDTTHQARRGDRLAA
ncbi:hypothetical protein [Bradyrhizobium zhanjiangense]|uniref:hypothetical protein n=1 Tax=Bradyrhizobium zhanjiangense TaxID=1325107 RepID=UPI001008B255|nr:hypothetical protein [Bradyrhizobium zhanjiangense]